MRRGPARRFDPPALHAALDRARLERGLSWADVADESGVAAGTIRRMREHGRFEADGVVALAAWVGRPVDDFTRPGDVPPDAPNS